MLMERALFLPFSKCLKIYKLFAIYAVFPALPNFASALLPCLHHLHQRSLTAHGAFPENYPHMLIPSHLPSSCDSSA
uniref:Uncharacterized protein n=1 Tax=Anopheles darlingi TaxID=43151 RepID=A0A2M4DKG0_ANODA